MIGDLYTCSVCNTIYDDATMPSYTCTMCNNRVCFHCVAMDTKDNVCDSCYDKTMEK